MKLFESPRCCDRHMTLISFNDDIYSEGSYTFQCNFCWKFTTVDAEDVKGE